MQLEAKVPRRLKKLWFVPVDLKTRSVEAPWSGLDPEVFGLMPAVLR